MRLKRVTAILVMSALTLTPVLPVFDVDGGGAAFAKDDKGGGGGNGGGNGGGSGGGNGNSGSKGNKSDKATSKSAKNADVGASEAGKMNGALKANISAVIAHIRNGQTKSGPVGLLAGLAVADTVLSEAGSELAKLQQLDGLFDALDDGVSAAGFKSVEEYLVVRSSGILTDEEMAVIDPLIAAVGGTSKDGLSLAVSRPSAADLQDAENAYLDAQDGVSDAEKAIAKALNKEGSLEDLLAAMRKKLAPHKSKISAAVN